MCILNLPVREIFINITVQCIEAMPLPILNLSLSYETQSALQEASRRVTHHHYYDCYHYYHSLSSP